MLRNGGVALIIAAAMLVGCTVAGDSPLGPGYVPQSDGGNLTGAAVGSHPGPICWGVWDVAIDPEQGTWVIAPLRSVEFMANVTVFLQPPGGSTKNFLLKDMQVDMMTQPGYIIVDVDVGLVHPFPGLDQYTGFDVRGVFMHDGQYASESDPDLTYAGPDVPRQLNPDGYTRWMNATEFTTKGILGFVPGALGTPGLTPNATLNPYKYFTDDLEAGDSVESFFADPLSAEDRGCFRPGSVNWRHYTLIWPEGPLDFQYAVVASYDEPDPIPPQNVPEDFPISANCAEAFHLALTDNGSTAYYESPGSYGGDLHLKLEVYDWGTLGHGGSVADEIGAITLESPIGLIGTPVAFDPATLVATPGTSAVSSVYEIDISGVQPSGVSGQTVLVRVTSAIHDTYDYGFGVAVPDEPLAAYMLFDAPIKPTSANAPTAVAEACTCLWIAPGESVTFSGEQSYSPNGDITTWEWEADGDSLYDDASGPTPTIDFPTAGDYYVDLRVTDEAMQTDTLDASEKLHVHVGSWTPPTAVSRIIPTIGFINFEGDFIGSGCTGPGISLYEWDFEGDCIWDYEHPTIGDTTHAYDVPDIYNAILRVTGTGCDLAETEVRMIDPLPVLENGNFWGGEWDPWTHGHGGINVTYIEELIPNDTFGHIVHFYRCCTNDGGVCWARQYPEYDVSGYDELYFNMFFNLAYDELYGDGWMGGEMAMAVKIVYDDGASSEPYWSQAWIGWDTADDGTWQWNTGWLPWYVKYHYQEQVTGGTWHEKKTIDLMTIDPPPITIKQVLIGSYGWDFETYFALPWFSEE